MKLTIKQNSLQKVLRVVQKSVSTKPQLPILSCILLKATKDSLFLYSTDLYTGVMVEIDATIKEEGSFAVPGKYFTQVINSISSPTIDMEVKDNSLLIHSKESETKLVGLNPEDFPSFPEISSKNKLIPVKDFQDALASVAFSSSTDQTRPTLTGILLSFESEKTQLIATDGFRLSIRSIDVEIEKEGTILIPSRPLVDIFKTAEEEKASSVSLSISGELKQAKFEVGSFSFYIRLLDGEYPPYKKIIPTQIKTFVSCNKNDLEEKLHQALIFNQDNSFITQFKISSTGVTLFSSSPSAGENTSELSGATIKGEEVTIAFNTRYLLDFIKVISDEWVEIEIVESLRPARLKVASLPDYQYVVMPFRVTS
jgi:DNA polymerase-3 subunit beta